MKTELCTADRLTRRLPRLAPALEQPDATLGALALDSLDSVELLCAIHEEFGLRLTEADFQESTRICDLITTIERKTNP